MLYFDIIPYDAAILIVSKLGPSEEVEDIISILKENSRKTYKDLCYIKFPKIFKYAKEKDMMFITYELLYLKLRNTHLYIHGSNVFYESFDNIINENLIPDVDSLMASHRDGLYYLVFNLIKSIYVKYIYKYMYEQRYEINSHLKGKREDTIVYELFFMLYNLGSACDRLSGSEFEVSRVPFERILTFLRTGQVTKIDKKFLSILGDNLKSTVHIFLEKFGLVSSD